MAHRWLAALVALAALALLAPSAHATTLVSVYSLQRHGARNVLPKGALLTEGQLIGGPTLLPQGQRQTYTAGVAFRARYLDNATCGASATCLSGSDPQAGSATRGTQYGVVGQAGVGFGNFDVFVRSSALDRSIMSGLCFFNGIFPPNPAAVTPTAYLPTGAQVVPIYTQSDPEDILIRAYTQCPTYQDRLEQWFGSAEFTAKANDTAELRAQVKAIMPAADVSLPNWWNVYDSINVWRTYGVGDPTPNFTDAHFAQIQTLAFWLEIAKSRSAFTGSLLGGVAVADLLSYLQGAAAAVRNGSQTYYRLVSLSGHYNTQLAVLSALEVDLWPPAAAFPWFKNIPKLAAVMVFELHAQPAAAAAGVASVQPDFFVRLVAQDGPSASYTVVPLPCASDAAAAALGSAGACSLADFVSYASPRSLPTAEEWCAGCSNHAVSACRIASAEAAAAAGGGGGKGAEPWQLAVAVVATFVGCVLLALAGLVGVRLWQRRGVGGGGMSKPAAELSELSGSGAHRSRLGTAI